MNKSSGRAPVGRPRGRPAGTSAGASDSRERILAAARDRFAAEGYQAVTMRSIATAAGVDVALVSYYFSSKQGVFGAAMALPVNPLDVIDRVLTTSDDLLASTFVQTFLQVWDSPVSGPALRSFAAAAVSDPTMTRTLRELIEREFLPRIATRLGGADGLDRAGAFVVQMSGLILSRYLMQIEPVASMPVEDVVRRFTPVLETIFWG